MGLAPAVTLRIHTYAPVECAVGVHDRTPLFAFNVAPSGKPLER